MVAFKSLIFAAAISAVSAANIGAGIAAALNSALVLYLPIISNELSSGLNFTNTPEYINLLANAYKDSLYNITVTTVAALPQYIAAQPPSSIFVPNGTVEDAASAAGAYNIIASAFNQTIISYQAAAVRAPGVTSAALTIAASLHFVLDQLTSALAGYGIVV